MKRILLVLTFLFIVQWLVAQPPLPEGLSIGDTVPDPLFVEVFNHKADTVRLSDYRGKLVILDFWNTRCISCLKAFPKIDSLQRAYGDRIQIIAVSKTGYRQTVDFFNRFTRVHRPGIPFITGDTVLADLFPHVGVPYHVWISPEGTVKHLASGFYLNRENLNLVLADKPTDIPQAAQRATYLETLLDTAYNEEIAYASYLVHRNTTREFFIEKKATRNEYTVSGSIQTMYQYLYRSIGGISFDPFRPRRTRLETNRPERYNQPSGLSTEELVDWMDNNMYFYQGRIPVADSVRLFHWVKTDFERYFDLKASVESHVLDCWAIVRMDSIDRLKTQGGKKLYAFYAENIKRPALPPVRTMQNYPFASFSLNMISTIEELTGQPCFDETGYKGNVDITFRGETLDHPTVEGIRRELRTYGLDLVPSKKKLEILVLKETTYL